MLRQSGSPGLD